MTTGTEQRSSHGVPDALLAQVHERTGLLTHEQADLVLARTHALAAQ